VPQQTEGEHRHGVLLEGLEPQAAQQNACTHREDISEAGTQR
jgi:hypothetical protein